MWDSGVRAALKEAARAEKCDFPGFGMTYDPVGDGSVLTSVMDVTDVATMKSAAAGLPLPVPPWEEFRPVFEDDQGVKRAP